MRSLVKFRIYENDHLHKYFASMKNMMTSVIQLLYHTIVLRCIGLGIGVHGQRSAYYKG